MKVARLVVLALLGALLLAACGDDDDSTYADAYNKARTRFVENIVEGQQQARRARTTSQAAGAVDGIGAAIDTFADDLAKIEPPDDVETLHADLVKQLKATSEQTDEISSGLASGDTDAAAAAQRAVGDILEQLERSGATVEAIRKKIKDS